MFVHNHTDRDIVCKRGELKIDSRGISLRFANVMTVDCYRQEPSGSWAFAPEEQAPEALRAAVRATAWDGTSVTASGWVAPPRSGLLAQRVTLRVGNTVRTLVARGKRRWIREGDTLVPSRPEAWEPLALRWAEAFGGSIPMPAGRDPLSGLPRPAFIAMHPQNPEGKGFAPQELAEGAELPRIELLEDQLARFGDLPIPGCFAPCGGRLAGLTLPVPEKHPARPGSYDALFAPTHVAPAYLILPWLTSGTMIELAGLDKALTFTVPKAALSVRARSEHVARRGVRLRALHLDAEQQSATCVWQHSVQTERPRLPDLDIIRSTEEATW